MDYSTNPIKCQPLPIIAPKTTEKHAFLWDRHPKTNLFFNIPYTNIIRKFFIIGA